MIGFNPSGSTRLIGFPLTEKYSRFPAVAPDENEDQPPLNARAGRDAAARALSETDRLDHPHVRQAKWFIS